MLRKVTVRFTGTSPLLMHNPKAMEMEKAPGPKVARNEKKELELAAYREDDGTLYFMADAFRRSLLMACKGIKIGMMGLEGIMKGSMFSIDDHVPLMHPKTREPLTTYKSRRDRAVNKKAGAIIIFRPMLEEWMCEVVFEVDDEYMPDLSLLVKVWNKGGKTVGVGAFRVEKGGRFGRYVAEIVEQESSVIWESVPEPKPAKKSAKGTK